MMQAHGGCRFGEPAAVSGCAPRPTMTQINWIAGVMFDRRHFSAWLTRVNNWLGKHVEYPVEAPAGAAT